MAGMLDLDISSLSRIERGKQALTPALAVKLEAMSKQKGLDLRAWVMAGLPDATKGGKKWKK
jgi:plasmid maintenance system antidote protein VapI